MHKTRIAALLISAPLISAPLAPLPALAADVEVVESYDAAVGELPEGVAVSPRGDIYVTLAPIGQLRKLDRKTHVGETLATFDIGGGFLLGMAFFADDLYVVVASFDAATSGVWRVDDDGNKARVVAFGGDELPNDLTFDRAGNMFVTESISGSVYRVPAGSSQRELWIQDPLLFGDIDQSPVPFPVGANGLDYDDQTDTLIVSNSQVPSIIEIPDDEGIAGDPVVLAAGEHLRGADGISLDANGDIFVVSNFNSTVLLIDRYSGEATIIADGSDGLVFPATSAFGQFGPDKKALFVTNFGFGQGPDAPASLLRIDVGVKSEKFPAGS